MSKFLELVNENTPSAEDFMEQLKRSGVRVEKTDTGYDFTFSIDLTNGEEEAEDYVAQQISGAAIDKTVAGLAAQAKLGGIGGVLGSVPGQAKAAEDKRKALYPQIITAFNNITNKISNALRTVNTSSR